ncbi:MAG: aldo/keto reductase [Bacteroidales bacterium]|jgi:D-threo-aldose 1-dehydrogenase|nr:aldo/keto reductase [Bacteroidales bacterium]
MQHRQIGNTGVNIPPVIFGTSALGNLYSALSNETKTAIVEECLKHVPAPVVFDSAGKYGAGLALEKLGEILTTLGARQEDVIISNKLGWLRTPLLTPEPTFEKGVWFGIKNDAHQSISYDGILECWQQGNDLLGGKFKPQLISVHDPDEYLDSARDIAEFKQFFGNIIKAYRSLSVLKSEGKVKAVGVGAKNWKTIKMIAGEVDLDWVMFANSMTIFRHPKELLDFMGQLHGKGVGMINSAVFHAGFLTGGSFFDYVFLKPDTAESRAKFKWRENFFTVCRKHNVTPADACVRFGMTPPGVLAISLNTSNPLRVKNNVESVETSIPDDFWKDMIGKNLIDKNYPYL